MMLRRFSEIVSHASGGLRRLQAFLRASVVFTLFALCVTAGILLLFPPAAQADNFDKEILLGANFSGRDLTDSSFTKANLRNSDFSGSNLQGVSFFGANLEDANLEGADLRNATLDAARLVDANLRNAILEGAFAFNTKFDRAIVDGADFTDVLLREDVQEKLCAIAQGINPVTGRSTRDTLECF